MRLARERTYKCKISYVNSVRDEPRFIVLTTFSFNEKCCETIFCSLKFGNRKKI